MATIILITGGSRSGKSTYAEKRAESKLGNKLYIATCPRLDDEMNERINKHVKARENRGWHTIEEELEITSVIEQNSQAEIILVDCLTLWINNLLYHGSKYASVLDENQIESLCLKLIAAGRNHRGIIFFVTNEVGSGIVPESSETRLYRDLVGKCNQVIAAHADEVVLVSCGIPLTLKNNHS